MSDFPIFVLFSGTGSTLKALIDKQQHYRIVGTLCNRPEAAGIQYAQQQNIPCHIIDHTAYPDRDSFDLAMMHCIDAYEIKLIVLAGFMRRLSNQFVQHYAHKIINIHPSLLPKYPGLHTYARALEAGDRIHGSTVHIVTNEIDSGPIIEQQSLEIAIDDNIASLMQKTKAMEQEMYPKIINQLALGKAAPK